MKLNESLIQERKCFFLNLFYARTERERERVREGGRERERERERDGER